MNTIELISVRFGLLNTEICHCVTYKSLPIFKDYPVKAVLIIKIGLLFITNGIPHLASDEIKNYVHSGTEVQIDFT